MNRMQHLTIKSKLLVSYCGTAVQPNLAHPGMAAARAF